MPRVISNINRKQTQTHDIRLETVHQLPKICSVLLARKKSKTFHHSKEKPLRRDPKYVASNFLKLKMTISNFYKFSNKNKKVTD